jgi:fimbrial chaperone protein
MFRMLLALLLCAASSALASGGHSLTVSAVVVRRDRPGGHGADERRHERPAALHRQRLVRPVAPSRVLGPGGPILAAMNRPLLALAACFFSLPACAGDFGVSPIRVDLDRGTKSALLTVTNDDARPLAFQVRAMEWTQDAAGADGYADTADLVYFPRQLKIPPKESRVVRLGYKVPALQAEKAYRLFIEELADPEARDSRTGVAITLRFGVPVFLRPAQARLAGEVALSVEGGAARALVRNTGNAHFRIASVRFTGLDAAGQTLFEQAVDGWYLLAGAARAYIIKLPAEHCGRARTLRAEALAENLSLRAEQAIAPGDCR